MLEAVSPMAKAPMHPPMCWPRYGPRRDLWWASPYSFTAQDFAWAVLSDRRSITVFGRIRPKLIARMISKAIEPSAIVALMRSHVLVGPWESCTRPLAILNRNTPGIIDTTE